MINLFKNEYAFLSNFYPCLIDIRIAQSPIVLDIFASYTSVEHAYQAQKTCFATEKFPIFCAPTAAAAKKLGRKVTMRPDWEAVKIDIMRELIRIKFSDPKLAKMLLDTGEEELIEGNWWGDTFWGMCKGQGQNRLGKLLMERRAIFRSQLPD